MNKKFLLSVISSLIIGILGIYFIYIENNVYKNVFTMLIVAVYFYNILYCHTVKDDEDN